VDLGTGTGLSGLVAGCLGAREVTFSDIGPVLDLTRENIALNLASLPDPTPTTTVVEVGLEESEGRLERSGGIISPTHVTNYSLPLVASLLTTYIPNPFRDSLRSSQYWWGSKTLPQDAFDVVLVADCILPKLYPMEPLVAAISDLLSPSGVCYVSYEHRTWFEFDPPTRFHELCSSNSLSVRAVSESELDEVFIGDDIIVWEVRKIVESK